MAFSNILAGTFLAAGLNNGVVSQNTVTMDHRPTTLQLSFDDSKNRNNARVNLMQSGCQLDTNFIDNNIEFETLRQLQFNSTNNLGVDAPFSGQGKLLSDLTVADLARYQLIDLFAMDQNGILACLPPKAGTTNWQRYFAGLLNSDKEPEDFEVPDVFDELPRVLKKADPKSNVIDLVNQKKDYTRMINTRHPFARLVSAWRQKFDINFWNSIKYMKKFGRKIAKYEDDEIPDTHHFSFKQFLLYIVNEKMEDYDYHWQSISYQCLPCQVNYDVIVHQETSSSDAEFFTEYKKLNGTTHLPGQYVDSPLLSSSLVDHFQGFPRSLIEKLYHIYFEDFLLFNYSIDEFIEVSDNNL